MDHPRGYLARWVNPAPAIDGHLDDPAWREASWTDAFVDIEGDTRPKPRLDTRVKMLWDDNYLYVGAEISEPHVWATLTEHDSVIFRDPDFEVFIDPNGDNHEYYEFEINARGTFWDLFLPKPYKDGGKADNTWEIPGLKSAVAVDGTINDPRDTDRGWSVELAFPWRVLAAHAHQDVPPRDQQWRVNFSRVEWPVEISGRDYRKPAGAKEDNWVWSPQYVINMHRPETWGYVQFSVYVPGSDRFVPDVTWPARRWLMRVYYAQVDYLKAHNRYADTLAELKITLDGEPLLRNPTLMTSGGTWGAAVDVLWVNDRTNTRRLSIRQDALIKVGMPR